MSRRVLGVALVGTSVLLGVLPSYGDAPPAPQLPMATCDARVNDGPNDGIATYKVVDANGVPNVADPRGNVPGLDIKAITLRVTATRVFAFMSIADIPETFRQTDSAYGYVMWFTRGGKIARFDQVYANPALAQQGLAPTTGYPTASVGSTASGGAALSGLGGGIDTTKDVAYVYADRASLEAQLGEPLADGEELTAINGRTELWETDGKTAPGVVRRPADVTDVPPASAVWKVGDDRCFGHSTIVVTGASPQYGDPATLTATVKDEAGAPLASRKVTFAVPGESAPRTLTTDTTGTVRIALDAAPPAGTYAVAVTYGGDEFSGSGQGSGTLTVRAETIRVGKLAVKASGSTRTVTATLTEDDPRPFAKQPVAWYVNDKKVATVVTDAAGRSVFKGAKAGQRVQARYAGVTGRYAAVASNTIAA
ncbi:MAG: hypothetical protein QOE45_324 [Frankiaceae bacterium]|jgi:hypothetical protein|nr:hypothetical protein [Frankiaceae bacterium]